MVEDTLCEVLSITAGITSHTMNNDGIRIWIEPPAPVCPAVARNLARDAEFSKHRWMIQIGRGAVMIDYREGGSSLEKDMKWHV